MEKDVRTLHKLKDDGEDLRGLEEPNKRITVHDLL